jgi:hypothetical protein
MLCIWLSPILLVWTQWECHTLKVNCVWVEWREGFGAHFTAVCVTVSLFRRDVLWPHTSPLDTQAFIIGLNVFMLQIFLKTVACRVDVTKTKTGGSVRSGFCVGFWPLIAGLSVLRTDPPTRQPFRYWNRCGIGLCLLHVHRVVVECHLEGRGTSSVCCLLPSWWGSHDLWNGNVRASSSRLIVIAQNGACCELDCLGSLFG